jgi:GNAT superfamily N-acetyltransferase
MGGDDKCVFVRVSELTEDLFERFYRMVLEPAFPPEELEDIQTVRAVHYEPSSPFVPGLVALRDGDPVGGALGELYGAANIVLLAYLAVRADCRGGGVGSALLERVLVSWRELVAPAAILAEVEDPRGRVAGPYADPSARLRFYERAGGKVLPIRYFQPSIGPGLPRVRGMLLICLDPWRESVAKDSVLAFLDEYIETAEGPEVRSADPEYLDLRGQVDSWPADIPLEPLSGVAGLPAPGQLLIGTILSNPNIWHMRLGTGTRKAGNARELAFARLDARCGSWSEHVGWMAGALRQHRRDWHRPHRPADSANASQQARDSSCGDYGGRLCPNRADRVQI